MNPPPSEGMVNHHYEERRLNEAIATLDEKYEEKYNQLQLEIQQKTKGKISRVHSLLNKSSPFAECIMAVQLSEKFKIPAIQTYIGVEDPIEYLDNYKTHMDLQGTPQELACQPSRSPCPVLLGTGSKISHRVPSRVLRISDENL